MSGKSVLYTVHWWYISVENVAIVLRGVARKKNQGEPN
jgi:hypothetical protein